MIWDLFENCTNQTFLNQQLLNLPVLDLWQIRYPPKKTLFIHLWAYVKRPTSKTGFSNRFWNCQFATYVKRDTSIFYLLHCYLICVTELTSFLAEQSSSSNWVFCENSPLFSLQGTLIEAYYLFWSFLFCYYVLQENFSLKSIFVLKRSCFSCFIRRIPNDNPP